ncbi:MAG: hypothetical protein SLAVMIC_00723 [uncultured marine phage]|uniref:Uncharacterized protein n=1 Tax=uncultured marine phage TaxID=707152 RepID=A0A8D9C9E7_9VIRU|nr:MAG: hypothetical protein SLAVMIC_00723 [uncultured marine phage]
MDEITLEELIDYSQDLEIEDVDFYDGLVLAYSSDHLFDIRHLEDDIEWMKDNGDNYSSLEVLHKYMERNEIEECYVVN